MKSMSLEELHAERERVLKEIGLLENRQKILLNKEGNIERRARTRRLIEHGAILESVYPCVIDMEGEEVKAFLKSLATRDKS